MARGLALSLLILMSGALPASASSSARRKELLRIQKELDKTRQEIEGYKKQQEGLSKQLHKLESHNVETRRRLEGLKSRIDVAERRRAELRGRMGGVKLASGFWSGALAYELREYAAESVSRDEAHGARGLWAEALRRAAIRDKAALLAGLAGARSRTEQAAAETTKEAASLRDRSRAAAAEQASSEKELAKTREEAEETRGRVAAAEKRARELEESAKALTDLLKAYGKSKPGAPVALDIPRRSLPWPVDGEIVRGFGKEKNEFGTVVIRQGVSFKTPPAAAVSAVRAGKVIFSGLFKSYGRVVIVDHGGAFYSIYGELAESLKEKGAAVRQGETLGRAAGTLYLELRRGVEALDPVDWLMRK